MHCPWFSRAAATGFETHPWRVPCRTVSRTEDFLHVGAAMRGGAGDGRKSAFSHAHPCTVDRRRAENRHGGQAGGSFPGATRAGPMRTVWQFAPIPWHHRSVRSSVRSPSSTGRPGGSLCSARDFQGWAAPVLCDHRQQGEKKLSLHWLSAMHGGELLPLPPPPSHSACRPGPHTRCLSESLPQATTTLTSAMRP